MNNNPLRMLVMALLVLNISCSKKESQVGKVTLGEEETSTSGSKRKSNPSIIEMAIEKNPDLKPIQDRILKSSVRDIKNSPNFAKKLYAAMRFSGSSLFQSQGVNPQIENSSSLNLQMAEYVKNYIDEVQSLVWKGKTKSVLTKTTKFKKNLKDVKNNGSKDIQIEVALGLSLHASYNKIDPDKDLSYLNIIKIGVEEQFVASEAYVASFNPANNDISYKVLEKILKGRYNGLIFLSLYNEIIKSDANYKNFMPEKDYNWIKDTLFKGNNNSLHPVDYVTLTDDDQLGNEERFKVNCLLAAIETAEIFKYFFNGKKIAYSDKWLRSKSSKLNDLVDHLARLTNDSSLEEILKYKY